ncbi:MAG: deoxyribodipyrimidine photolyase [Syntrophobacteraceae bacterium]
MSHRVDRVPSGFPIERIVLCNEASVNTGGEFVLYWMTAFRRAQWNFSLERAAGWAQELGKPLIVLEALRCDYRWASDRFHSFVLEGMRDNRSDFKDTAALYYPFVERFKGEGKGLVRELASRACIVITDHYPSFFLPRMTRAAAKKIAVRMEAVDSNGLLPMGITDRVFLSAYSFRRFLQHRLPGFLDLLPKKNPLAELTVPVLEKLPTVILEKWPIASREIINASPEALKELPIDHNVRPAATRGGSRAAKARLLDFIENKLDRYHEDRNHPDREAASGLSPYLHFGQISAHEIFFKLKELEQWTPWRLSSKASGQREGWWGMSTGAEAFLDQLITWRELGFNICSKRADYDQFDSLPDWAKKELGSHENDDRRYIYSLDELESARTHDPLWNAAQKQLLAEGTMHNYLRMLWGKKILEWTPSPRQALEIMIELNNRFALDGRDPNSYTGIFWVLGRYDRPFGPARPVFGKIRYMSTRNTMKKIRVIEYMQRFGTSAD